MVFIALPARLVLPQLPQGKWALLSEVASVLHGRWSDGFCGYTSSCELLRGKGAVHEQACAFPVGRTSLYLPGVLLTKECLTSSQVGFESPSLPPAGEGPHWGGSTRGGLKRVRTDCCRPPQQQFRSWRSGEWQWNSQHKQQQLRGCHWAEAQEEPQ